MKALRAQIHGQLETAASRVIESYRTFMNEEPEAGDARAFAAHHAACKAALAHLDLLMKLAKIAGLETDAAEGDEEQARLLAQAREALNDDEGHDDDDRVGG